jgi:hypothetical protein
MLETPSNGGAQDLREIMLEEERKEIMRSSLVTSLP